MHVLPGGRLGAESWWDTARLSAGAARFFGLRPRQILRVGRAGDRDALHRLEADWGRDVADFLDIKWEVAGLENVVPGRRYVVAALHEGFADALALLRLGLDLRFVARDELAEWPTLGRYLSDTNQLIVTEGRSRVSYRRLIAGGAAALDAGEALVLFPQGSILGVETAFWPGAFRLADKLDAWILPVALTGSHRVWEYPYSPQVRFGQRMSVRVLHAVEPGRAVDQARVIERQLKQLALSGDMAAPRRFEPEVDGYWDDYRYEIDPDFPDLAALVAEHRRAAAQ
ncbi:MAG: lysophospholipid acyltransferase family protein [Acidimicrobiia bacterium]